MKKSTLKNLPIVIILLMIFSFLPQNIFTSPSFAAVDDATELELPYEYGEPIMQGPAALAAKAQGVAIGEGEVYYAINGDPARFYAADSETGEVIYTQSLPNSDVVWAMTVGADGNVYFSGTFDGILYRYNVDDQTVTEVGVNPSDNWVWQLKSTTDGKIYGGTYPEAKAFEYDIYTEEFIDLGTFADDQQYARGIGVTEDSLYVGIGTTASLHKMDRETGDRTEINLPITGEQTSVSNIWEYNGYLFVAYGTSLLTLDVETEEVVHEMYWEDLHTFDGLISPPSPYEEDLIYFRDKQTGELWTYHMEDKSMQAVEPKIQLPGSALKSMEWIKDEQGKDVLAMLHHQLEYSIFNPETNELSVVYPEADMQGLAIQSMELGPDNNLYIGGYQGSFGVFDPESEEYLLRERDPHQIEGVGFLNGKVYLGTYGGARIFEYDPELPFTYSDGGVGNNPKFVYGIPDDQSRPFTFATGEDKLFVGTISDYGKLGGSLAIYDAKADVWSSTRHVVEDQSIIGLAYHNGILFGGTTTAGGLGISPTKDKAKMFTYDVDSDSYNIFDLEVEGVKTPKMIGELSMGPDGNLWGIAHGLDADGVENTVVFSMDPETKEIIKQKALYSGSAAGSSWRPFYIRWDNQGYLYTTAARKLTIIDPETMASKQLFDDKIEVMDLDNEGNIYYAQGADLIKRSATLIEVPEDVFITNITDLNDLEVAYGTKNENLNLPELIEVSLSDDSSIDVLVKWDNAEPLYNGEKSGTYIFSGELDLSETDSVVNPDELTPVINVIVLEEKVIDSTPPEEDNDDDSVPPKENEDDQVLPDEDVVDNPSKQNKDGESLPKTATNIFNLLGFGVLLIVIASVIMIIRKKYKMT